MRALPKSNQNFSLIFRKDNWSVDHKSAFGEEVKDNDVAPKGFAAKIILNEIEKRRTGEGEANAIDEEAKDELKGSQNLTSFKANSAKEELKLALSDNHPNTASFKEENKVSCSISGSSDSERKNPRTKNSSRRFLDPSLPIKQRRQNAVDIKIVKLDDSPPDGVDEDEHGVKFGELPQILSKSSFNDSSLSSDSSSDSDFEDEQPLPKPDLINLK